MKLINTEPRPVPWMSWDEWSDVDRLLCSAAAGADHRRGVARVDAWRARGSLPGVVDATARLRELALDDTAAVRAGRSDIAVRLAYSMAIVQLVNGVTGRIQKSKEKKSVSDLSREMGLPQLLVDLRHDATHKALPSMQRLRAASRAALAWLERFYWEPQRDYIELVFGTRPSAILLLLRKYLRASAARAEEPVAAAIDAVVDAVQDLRHRCALSEVVVPLLLDGACRRRAFATAEDLMVPLAATAAARARAAGEPPAKVRRTARAAPAVDFASLARRFVRRRDTWLPLLAALNARWPSLAPLLLEGVVSRLLAEERGAGRAQCARLYFLCSWAQLLLHSHGAARGDGEGEGGGGDAKREGSGDSGGAAPFDPLAAIGRVETHAKAMSGFEVRRHVAWLASAGESAATRSSLWSVWLVCALFSADSAARAHLVANGADDEANLSDIVRLERVAAVRFAALKMSADPAGIAAGAAGVSTAAAAAAAGTAPTDAAWERCAAWYASPIGSLQSGASLPPNLDLRPSAPYASAAAIAPLALDSAEVAPSSSAAAAAAAVQTRGLELTWW
jgi:hypothetical protein